MVNLTAAWAEAYQNSHPSIEVTTVGGGSSTGIAGLLKGSAHIAATVRELNDAEEKAFVGAHGELPKATLIGYKAAAVFVHKDNPVASVSIEDLREIFAYDGHINDWKDLVPNYSGPIMGLDIEGSTPKGNSKLHGKLFFTAE